jgi:hypothetical protein
LIEANLCHLVSVARATSAAPTYFKAQTIEQRIFGDGGFGCNNPSGEAYREVKDMHNGNGNAIRLLMSIGTGVKHRSKFFDDSSLQKFFKGMRAAFALATDTHEIHEYCLEQFENRPETYFRFNVDTAPQDVGDNIDTAPPDLGDIPLDRWKKGTVKKESTNMEMRRLTQIYLNQPRVREEMNSIAKVLVLNRRRRAETPRWKESMGHYWICHHRGCSQGQLPCRREELEQHLQVDHNFGPIEEQTPETRRQYEDYLESGRYEAT